MKPPKTSLEGQTENKTIIPDKHKWPKWKYKFIKTPLSPNINVSVTQEDEEELNNILKKKKPSKGESQNNWSTQNATNAYKNCKNTLWQNKADETQSAATAWKPSAWLYGYWGNEEYNIV